jgi:hypothetical protein
MRVGFFVGFVAAAMISSLFSRPRRAEAPGTGDTPAGALDEVEARAERARENARGVLQELKERWQEAVAGGREAAREKEEELKRDYEESTRPQPGPRDPRYYR